MTKRAIWIIFKIRTYRYSTNGCIQWFTIYDPLVVLRSYFAEWIYTNEEPRSIASKERDSRFLNILISTLSKQDGGIQFTELEPYIIPYIATAGTGFFIEEPELNLFPSTQRDILYNLISSVQQREDDSLILTTHSPYILYALNNCMLGFQVKETIAENGTGKSG